MNTWSWAREELRRWRATPTRLLLVLAPLLATAICLCVYSTRTVRNLPVAVVDLDRTGLSRTLVRDLSATPQMQIRIYSDPDEVKTAFRRGVIRAAAILPDGLDQKLRTGRTAKIVFWRDASNPMTANQLYSAMATVVATEGARLVAGRLMQAGLSLSQAKEMAVPLRTDPRAFANPSFDYLANFAPGLFPMFVQMGLMLAAGSMLSMGWRQNPSPWREFVGRSIPWMAVYGLTAFLFYGVAMPLLGAPVVQIAATMALVATLFAASLACGAVFGRFIPNPVQAGQFLLAFNTPAFPLSGYTFPEWAMPPVLSMISRPMPFSLFVDAYRGLAGWPTARPIAGWLGLAAWFAGSVLLLSIPSRKNAEQPKSVAPVPDHDQTFSGTFKREFLQLTRAPGLSTLVLAAPAIYMALYGGMYAGKSEHRVPLAVTGGLVSSFSREISTSLAAHPDLGVVHMSQTDARAALQRNQIRGILEIPENLDVRIRRREATPIPLLFIADRFLPANDLQRSIGEVLSSFGARERMLILEAKGLNPTMARERATALQLDDRPLGNPRETYGDFMLPGLGILILHQLCLIGAAFASAANPQVRRLKDFVVRITLLAGWYGSWCAIWIGIVLPAMSVPTDPQILSLILLSSLGLVASCIAGSVVGIVVGEPGIAAQLLAFTSYPFFFSSGASWPRELFPTAISWFGSIVPVTPWINGSNRALRMGAGLADIAPNLAHLGILVTVWAAMLFVVAQLVKRKTETV